MNGIDRLKELYVDKSTWEETCHGCGSCCKKGDGHPDYVFVCKHYDLENRYCSCYDARKCLKLTPEAVENNYLPLQETCGYKRVENGLPPLSPTQVHNIHSKIKRVKTFSIPLPRERVTEESEVAVDKLKLNRLQIIHPDANNLYEYVLSTESNCTTFVCMDNLRCDAHSFDSYIFLCKLLLNDGEVSSNDEQFPVIFRSFLGGSTSMTNGWTEPELYGKWWRVSHRDYSLTSLYFIPNPMNLYHITDEMVEFFLTELFGKLPKGVKSVLCSSLSPFDYPNSNQWKVRLKYIEDILEHHLPQGVEFKMDGTRIPAELLNEI